MVPRATALGGDPRGRASWPGSGAGAPMRPCPPRLPNPSCRGPLRRVRGNDKLSDSPFRRMIRASEPDFWRLWCVGLVVFTVRWLETVAVGVVVYQRSESAFLVAMTTMLRL